MKVNVEVDCTPLEARQFFGLPDVQPMQKAMMEDLQTRMKENVDKFTPEALMKTWFTFDPKDGRALSGDVRQSCRPRHEQEREVERVPVARLLTGSLHRRVYGCIQK